MRRCWLRSGPSGMISLPKYPCSCASVRPSSGQDQRIETPNKPLANLIIVMSAPLISVYHMRILLYMDTCI